MSVNEATLALTSGLESAAHGIQESNAPLLEVSGLTKTYRTNESGLFSRRRKVVHAVNEIDFCIASGQTLGVVGESGCGKSTVARLILRLVEADAGRIVFDGTDVRSLNSKQVRTFRKEAQIVFQDPYGSLNPRMTASASVRFNLDAHGINGTRATERTQWAFEMTHIPWSYSSRYPHELSGGQRQRVNIARAIALRPRLVVLDEPVSALDKSVQAQVLTLLLELQRELGLTYLFISHDLHVVRYVSDRVLVMYLGKVVESGPAQQVYRNPSHPYTRALLASAVDAGAIGKRPEPLQGEVPSPLNPPGGCRFHTRCPMATPVCRQTAPPDFNLGEGHVAACHVLEGGIDGPVC
jgi:peptide/nickel transport system ATP-binding protein